MTDSAQTIDPARPWITDPDDAPSQLKWLPTLFNPMGSTPRLHFTRAWTLLFFARVFAFIVPAVFVTILSGAGAENPEAAALPVWGFPLVIVLTALLSLNLHISRLTNARRSPVWAAIVMLPVLFGAAGFLFGAMQGAQSYDQALVAYERQQAGLPPIEQTEAAEADASGDREAAASESEDAGGGGRGERGGREEDPLDVTEVSARAHALTAGFGLAQAFWALPAFGVMIWSLMWVGRLPNGGGTIKERLAHMEQGAANQV